MAASQVVNALRTIPGVPASKIVAATDNRGAMGTPVELPNVIDMVTNNVPANLAQQGIAVADECDSIVADIAQRLREAAADCITACQEVGDACCGCITARVAVIGSIVKPIINRCYNKIGKAAADRFAVGTDFLHSIGCTMPSPDALAAIAAGVPVDQVMSSTPATSQPVAAGVNVAASAPAITISGGSISGPSSGACPPGTVPSGLIHLDGTPVCVGSIVNQPPGGGTTPPIPPPIVPPITPPFTGGTGLPPPFTGGTGDGTSGPIDPCSLMNGSGGVRVYTNPPTESPRFWYTLDPSTGLAVTPDGRCETFNAAAIAYALLIAASPGGYDTTGYSFADTCCDQTGGGSPPPPPPPGQPCVSTACQSTDPNGANYVDPSQWSNIETATFSQPLTDDQQTSLCMLLGKECISYSNNADGTSTMCMGDSDDSNEPPAPTDHACDVVSTVNRYLNIGNTTTASDINPLPDDGKTFVSYSLTDGLTFDWNALFVGVVNGFMGQVQNMLNLSPIPSDCANPAFAGYVATGAVLGFLQRYAGIVPESAIGINQQDLNFSCQWKLPELGTAHTLHVKGWINDDEWKTLVAAGGYCIPWQQIVNDASYSYPQVTDTIQLWRRKLIDDLTLTEYMTRAGVKDDSFTTQFVRLTDYVPPVAETVTWGQKQVTDDANAEALGLDDGFDDWMNGDGVLSMSVYGEDSTTARNQWRCAWALPGIDDAVDAFARISEPTSVPGSERNVNPVTASELQAICDMHKMPNGWADRLMYLSFRQISMRQLRQLYVSGQVDVDGLIDRFRKLRYTPDDATLMAQALAAINNPAKAKLQGLPTQQEIVNLYRADGLDRITAQALIVNAGVQGDAAGSILDTADLLRDATMRRANVATLRRRFMAGDYSSDQATVKLGQYGVAVDRIAVVIAQWQEALTLKVREVSVSNLCEWAGRGYITPITFAQRLANLGYTMDDASNFMTTCNAKHSEAVAKELAAKQKQLLAQIAKEAKAAATAARQQQKAALAAAKAADPFRDPPKPYRTPKTTKVHQVKDVATGTGTPVETTTDSVTTSSG